MVKVLCRMSEALDLCVGELSPGGGLAGSVLIAASAGSSKRGQQGTLSPAIAMLVPNLANALSLQHKMQHSGGQTRSCSISWRTLT